MDNFQKASSIHLGDILMDTNTVKKHRGNDVFLINSRQSCNCIIVGSTFLKQDIFGSSISLYDIEIWKFFTEETSSLRINLDNFSVNTAIF